MTSKDGKTVFSAYVFTNDEKNKIFFSKNDPEIFVQYGQYEMRVKDKILIKNEYVIKAKVKWYGIGNYAYLYLWKENKENKPNTEYKESSGDLRLSKKNI